MQVAADVLGRQLRLSVSADSVLHQDVADFIGFGLV